MKTTPTRNRASAFIILICVVAVSAVVAGVTVHYLRKWANRIQTVDGDPASGPASGGGQNPQNPAPPGTNTALHVSEVITYWGVEEDDGSWDSFYPAGGASTALAAHPMIGILWSNNVATLTISNMPDFVYKNDVEMGLPTDADGCPIYTNYDWSAPLPAGVLVQLQYSVNFGDWIAMDSITLQTNQWSHYQDLSAVDGQRFYRAMILP